MKKILILSLLCITGIAKMDSHNLANIQHARNTLYGVSLISGFQTLREIYHSMGRGTYRLRAIPLAPKWQVYKTIPYTKIPFSTHGYFQFMMPTGKNIITRIAKSSPWGILSAICYSFAEKLGREIEILQIITRNR